MEIYDRAQQTLNQEGAEIGEQVVAALSPYIRQHINRFGRYQLDLTQPPPPLNYDIRVVTSKKKSAGFVTSEAQKKAKAGLPWERILAISNGMLKQASQARHFNHITAHDHGTLASFHVLRL